MTHILDNFKEYIESKDVKVHCRFLNRDQSHLSILNNFFYFQESFPVTKSYYGKVPKQSLIGLNYDIRTMTNIPFTLIRDGIYGVYNFFKLNPKPINEGQVNIIIPYFCSSLIPESWEGNCLLYNIEFSEIQSAVKELFIHGCVNSTNVNTEYIENILKRSLDFIDKDCVVKPILKFQNQKFYGHGKDESELLVMTLEAIHKIYNGYNIDLSVKVSDIIDKNYNGNGGYINLNYNALINYDNFLNYKLSSDRYFNLSLNNYEERLKVDSFKIKINERMVINIFEKNKEDKSKFKEFECKIEEINNIMKKYINNDEFDTVETNKFLFIEDLSKELIKVANEIYKY